MSYKFLSTILGIDANFTGIVGIGTTSPISVSNLTIKESASVPLAISMQNRNSTQVWNIAVDAAAVDDGILTFNSGTPFGISKMVITSSGNVGIGNTSPTQKLQVGDGTGTGNQYVRVVSSSSDIYIGQSGGGLFGLSANAAANIVQDNSSYPLAIGTTFSQPLIFGTTNAERMRIASNGFVGIGVNNPLNQLVLPNNQYLAWKNSVGIESVGISTDSSNSLIFFNVSERMRIASSGNVLIGTTTDNGAKLQVSASLAIAQFNGTSGSGGYITLQKQSNDISYIGASTAISGQGTNVDFWAVSGYGISLYSNGNPSYNLTLTSGGNVGIGTTNPIDKLHVEGGITSTSIANPLLTNIGSIQMCYDGTNGIIRTWNSSPLIYQAYNYQSFETTGSERMRIASSGNILIGTTTDNGVRLNVNGVTQAISLIDSTNARTTSPGGGVRITSNYAETGAIKIKMPDAVFNSSTMMYFTVKIYQYNTGNSYELQIGGYNYVGGGWYNVFATNLTDAGHELKVRWGNDGSSNCVWIGELTDVWVYPQVWISDFQGGYGGVSPYWADGWHITFETAFDTVNLQRTAAQVITSNSIGTYGITGSGTTNYLPKFTGSTSIGNSLIYDNGTNIGIGTTSPTTTFDVNGSIRAVSLLISSDRLYLNGNRPISDWISSSLTAGYSSSNGYGWVNSQDNLLLGTNGLERMRIASSGNVLIGTTIDNGYKLDVNGIIRVVNPNSPSTGIITAKLLAYSPSPFGLVFRAISSGVNSIQSQREGNDSEVFGLSLNPNGGDVGIGTETPQQTASGRGNLTINGTNSSILSLSTNNLWSGYLYASPTYTEIGSQGYFQIAVNGVGTAALYIATSGNVGIGTTTPNGLWSGTNKTLQITAGTNVSSELVQSRTGASISRFLSGTSSSFGVYTADSLNYEIYTSAVSRFYITSSGNVGIGTTSPAYKLQVDNGDFYFNRANAFANYYVRFNHNNSQDGGILFSRDNTTLDWQMNNNAGSGDFLLYSYGTGNIPFFIARNSGNVLIGTTTDNGAKLQVNGFSYFGSDVFTFNNGGIFFSGYGSYGRGIYSNSNGLTLQTSGSPKVTINDAGNVGIGTNNPTLKLEVDNTTTGEQCSLGIVADSVANVTDLSSKWYYTVNNSIKFHRGGNSTGGEISIWTTPEGGSLTERVRINSGGNVGIGTTSPTAKLVVTSINQIAKFETANTTLYTSYAVSGVDVGYIGNGSGTVSGSYANDFGLQAVNSFVVATGGGSERFRIATGGNVLIGTTTDAGYKLNVNGSAYASTLTDGYITISGAQINRTSGTVELQFNGSDSVRIFGNTAYPITFASGTGVTTVSNLGGSGTRMVVADGSGTLSTQAIPGGIVKAYGSWQTNTTQTSAFNNYPTPIYYNTADFYNNVIIDNDSSFQYTLIKMQVDGKFNIQFSAQFQNTDSQIQDVTIWLRKNGETTPFDVANSAGLVSIPNSHGGAPGTIIASWNYFVEATAGEYFQLVWSTTNHTRVTMQYYAPGSPPPGAASVILTVNKID